MVYHMEHNILDLLTYVILYGTQHIGFIKFILYNMKQNILILLSLCHIMNVLITAHINILI